MNHINVEEKRYYWGNSFKESFCIYYHSAYDLFYFFGPIEEPIIECRWTKEEFMLFINICKECGNDQYYNRYYLHKNAINDLESNLDKYLDMATIKNIIE